MKSRKEVIELLKKLRVKVCGTSEEFGTSGSGIWVSLEEGLLANYAMHNASGIEAYYSSEVHEALFEAGWFLEIYDYGTAMIYPIDAVNQTF